MRGCSCGHSMDAHGGRAWWMLIRTHPPTRKAGHRGRRTCGARECVDARACVDAHPDSRWTRMVDARMRSRMWSRMMDARECVDAHVDAHVGARVDTQCHVDAHMGRAPVAIALYWSFTARHHIILPGLRPHPVTHYTGLASSPWCTMLIGTAIQAQVTQGMRTSTGYTWPRRGVTAAQSRLRRSVGAARRGRTPPAGPRRARPAGSGGPAAA